MKLLHFSDTHLGFSEYYKIDSETGLNQREQDFYQAWSQVIQAILDHQPDLVVHAGDLFHTPRPSNRAIRTAMEGIQKISDAGIPMFIISGNHETPRIRSTGSIFESLELFPHVFTAYSSRYQTFDLENILIHCLPHCSLSEELEEAFACIQINEEKLNILVAHGAWGGKSYGMGEFNEQRLPDIESHTGCRFTYIALGHYHRYVAINDHTFYCSSTERTSLNEHNSTCGYLLVDLSTGDRSYHEIDTRPMVRHPEIDCTGLTTASIYQELETLASLTPEHAIVQISLSSIESDVFLKLDTQAIDELFEHTFYLEKAFTRRIGNTGHVSNPEKLESLPLEFERYIENLPDLELDKKRLQKLGASFLVKD